MKATRRGNPSLRTEIARCFRTILSILVLTAFKVHAQSQSWTTVDLPQFNNIQSVAVNSKGFIFLGQRDGYVLVSKDSGSSFQQVSDSGFANDGIGSLIIGSDDHLLLGTGTGFYVSTDNGLHWAQENNGLNFPALGDFYALGIDSSYVIASTGEGLFRSSNEGHSWSQIGVPPFYAGIIANCFLISRNGVLLAGTNGGVYGTTDYGTIWTKMDSGLPPPYTNVRSLAMDSAGNIYAGTDSSIYESTNNGGNWTLLFTTKPYAYVNALSVASNGNLLAGTSDGFYLSSDKGASWNFVPVPVDSSTYVWTLRADGQGDIYAGTGTDGVFRSTDDGDTWTQLDTGPGYAFITALACDSSGDIYAGTVGGSYDSMLRSTNAGGSWTLASGLPRAYGGYPTIHAIAAGEKEIVFAATDANGVLVSTDFGKDWSHSGALTTGTVFSLAVGADGFVYAGTDSGVFESTDNGASWTYLGLYNDDDILSVAVDSAGDVFAGTGHVGFGAPLAYPRIFLLSHLGGGWTQVYGNPSAADINAIAVDSEGFVYAVTSPLNTTLSSIIVRSEDGGTTWTETDSGIVASHASLVTLTVDKGDSVFAGDNNGNGVFVSSDQGTTWKEDTSGLGVDNYIVSLTSNSAGDLFAGSNVGVIFEYQSHPSVTLVKRPLNSTPNDFALNQNYPNPFNPTTVISYQISAVSDVSLDVYDVLGRKVETLVKGKENAGRYSVTFDGGKFASGVYFYRLAAGDFESVKKLVLIK